MERELYKEVYREQAEELCALEAAQTEATVEGWQMYGHVYGEETFRCTVLTWLSAADRGADGMQARRTRL
jgi:hypothetical protein